MGEARGYSAKVDGEVVGLVFAPTPEAALWAMVQSLEFSLSLQENVESLVVLLEDAVGEQTTYRVEATLAVRIVDGAA